MHNAGEQQITPVVFRKYREAARKVNKNVGVAFFDVDRIYVHTYLEVGHHDVLLEVDLPPVFRTWRGGGTFARGK